jgi:alpha-tubulin suppressor-like RCC1 family protein
LPAKVTAVDGFDDIVQLAGGHDSMCALTAAGSVFCWGRGDGGFAGNGTYGTGACPQGGSVCYTEPSQTAVSDAVEIAVGDSTAIARRRDGTIVAWGGNDRGQCGIGTPSNPLIMPQPVLGFP